MKSCCLEGTVHTGQPTGRIDKLYDLDCYIAEPPNNTLPKALIVLLPDVFGWTLPNNRLIADTYARRTGARVYLPDFMNGNAFPAETMQAQFGILAPSDNWGSAIYNKTFPILKLIPTLLPRFFGITDTPCRPRILSFLSSLRASSTLPIGAAGFCWGGHHVVDLCAGLTTPSGQPLIDAGYTGHPGNLTIPSDFEKVKLPLSVIIGDADFVHPKEQCEEAKRTLEAKGQPDRYEFVILEGARHGFANRHEVGNKEPERLAKVAEDQAVEFWARWIGTERND